MKKAGLIPAFSLSVGRNRGRAPRHKPHPLVFAGRKGMPLSLSRKAGPYLKAAAPMLMGGRYCGQKKAAPAVGGVCFGAVAAGKTPGRLATEHRHGVQVVGGKASQAGDHPIDAPSQEPPGVAVGDRLYAPLGTEGLPLGRGCFLMLDHYFLKG